MTRINLVRVGELSDQHLLAEHREIVRIPNCVRNGKLSGSGAPANYVLGTGHVKFFHDKILFLSKRYSAIRSECVARSFAVKDMSSAFEGLPESSCNDYEPSDAEIEISKARLREKLEAKPGFYRFTRIT